MTDRAIIFLHGWLMTPEMWDHQIEAFGADYRCIAVAQPGHGGPKFEESVTMAEWADHLGAYLSDLGVERAVFVGHSMGGFLIQEMWRRHMDRVVALAPVSIGDEAWPEERRQGFLERVDRCAAEWTVPLASEMYGRLIGETFLRRNPGWVPAQCKVAAQRFDFAAIARLGRAIASHDDFRTSSETITVPVVAIHGLADAAVNVDESRRMVARIPGARIVELPGVGHAPPMESPERTTDALSDLLGEVEDKNLW